MKFLLPLLYLTFLLLLPTSSAISAASDPGVQPVAHDMREDQIEARKALEALEEKARLEHEAAREEAHRGREKIASDRSSLQQAIADIEAELAAEETVVAALEEQSELLAEQETQLTEQLAATDAIIRELVGGIRIFAKDITSHIAGSLQHGLGEYRGDLIDGIAQQGKFPGIEEIKEMITLLWHQIRGAGSVRLQRANIIDRNGNPVEADVLVLGDFTAAYQLDGEIGFLAHTPATEKLFALSGLPSRAMQKQLRSYIEGSSEAVPLDISRDPAHLSAWLNLANAAYELENYQRAAFCFDRAFALNNEADPDNLYYSAVAYLLAGDYDACISRFERLLHKFAGHVITTWRENYVHALLAAERNREALPTIKLLSESYQESYQGEKQMQWQEILLHQYLFLEMMDEARAYARRLTETAPNQAKWWKALAHILLQEGDYRQALASLVIRSYLEPLDQQELQLVADLYLQIGVPQQAAPLYRQLAAEKNDRRTLLKLVIALRQIEAHEEALALLEEITITTEDAQMVAHKADLLYELKRFQEAAALYQRLAHLDKDQANHAQQMHEYALLQAEASSGSAQKSGRPVQHSSDG